jgi:hypothetical protein
VNIVRTTEDLVPSVLSVAKATAENNVTEEQRQKFGFLRPYSEAEYIAFTKRADHFYSLLDEGRLIAFFLAHSIDLACTRFG